MWKDKRTHYWLSALVIAGGVIGYFVHMSSTSAAIGCNPTAEQVMAKMITTARPDMGPVERDFWHRVTRESADRKNLPPEVWLSTVITENNLKGQGLSNKGAQGASQVMPFWKTKLPECKVDLQEIEPNLNCGASILSYELTKDNNIEAALKRYNGPAGTQAYSDPTLARIARARLDLCASERKTDAVVAK